MYLRLRDDRRFGQRREEPVARAVKARIRGHREEVEVERTTVAEVIADGCKTGEVVAFISERGTDKTQGAALSLRQSGLLAHVSPSALKKARQKLSVLGLSSGCPVSRRNAWTRSGPYRPRAQRTSSAPPNSRMRPRMYTISRSALSRRES